MLLGGTVVISMIPKTKSGKKVACKAPRQFRSQGLASYI